VYDMKVDTDYYSFGKP